MSLLTILLMLQAGAAQPSGVNDSLGTDDAGYVYVMCVGSRMEEFARNTQDSADDVLRAARAACAEITQGILSRATDRESATSEIAEMDRMLESYASEAVARLRQRDRDWLRRMEERRASNQ